MKVLWWKATIGWGWVWFGRIGYLSQKKKLDSFIRQVVVYSNTTGNYFTKKSEVICIPLRNYNWELAHISLQNNMQHSLIPPFTFFFKGAKTKVKLVCSSVCVLMIISSVPMLTKSFATQVFVRRLCQASMDWWSEEYASFTLLFVGSRTKRRVQTMLNSAKEIWFNSQLSPSPSPTPNTHAHTHTSFPTLRWNPHPGAFLHSDQRAIDHRCVDIAMVRFASPSAYAPCVCVCVCQYITNISFCFYLDFFDADSLIYRVNSMTLSLRISRSDTFALSSRSFTPLNERQYVFQMYFLQAKSTHTYTHTCISS